MKWIIFLYCVIVLSACRNPLPESLPVKPPLAPVLEKWKVTVKEDFQRLSGVTNLPHRIFVLPPIRIDANGQPQEQLDVQVGLDGEKYCVTTNLLAIRLQQKISNLMLQDDEVTLLSYDQFLQLEGQRDVAALASYYSDPIHPSLEVDDSGARVEMVYFQTELFSLPASMDMEQRSLMAIQKLFFRYHSDVAWQDVLFRTFPYLISNLGAESQNIKQLYWSDLDVTYE